jgi:hypothetical protein
LPIVGVSSFKIAGGLGRLEGYSFSARLLSIDRPEQCVEHCDTRLRHCFQEAHVEAEPVYRSTDRPSDSWVCHRRCAGPSRQHPEGATGVFAAARHSAARPADARSADARPADARFKITRPADARFKITRPAGARSSGARRSDTRRSGVRRSDARSSGVRRSGARRSDTRRSGVRRSDARSSGVRRSDARGRWVREPVATG